MVTRGRTEEGILVIFVGMFVCLVPSTVKARHLIKYTGYCNIGNIVSINSSKVLKMLKLHADRQRPNAMCYPSFGLQSIKITKKIQTAAVTKNIKIIG